jgi:DNA end-binding protein Ku
MAMAKTLVNQMTVEWDPHKYKDEYKDTIMKVIDEKVKTGGEEIDPAKKPARRAANIVDLADVLRRSLQQTAAKRGKKPAAAPARPKKKAA